MNAAKARLKTIEGKLTLKSSQELSWGEIMKVVRLICSWEDSKLEDKDKITMKEWQRYMEHEIALAKSRGRDNIWFKPMEKVEKELLRNESHIKRMGGFKTFYV